ncbi:Mannitol-1-phosphate dehydrogenase [Trichophyton interdigitale]|uniref:Mannitol-1-phosphate 5-dehydrogenase n=1 Tax=Trichophyton interdigitale (strain MR816) TaxID=1215338 RepID=A0A059J5L0_TRIIM|nr:Mannitol-1-phosphate dehydrogenase [Trichophyton interdigitale]KAG5218473.1 Mannitol-1-phosphate dehydrogenase [Trichophyton interdigitale]KAG8208347.1 Mannitol-1-phosphate dehydrogenase [Trichophyton interdigitale]KDB22752.1 mannitol-1-phosphate 5-dehydrogenase [Trichophyton interdigitale MR816]
MQPKKAIHFGGGNIGRGFVAEFLHESDYEVVFIDVMDQVIENLQKSESYTVTEISSAGENVKKITNYRAINSKYNMEDVIREISTAEVVTCAVGPNILKFIASPIAKGIDARTIKRPLAVIACENAIGATDSLASFIKEHTDKDRLATLSDRARFANSAIDRIVPTQDPDAGLNVKIEKFYEWAVDQTPFGDWGHPDIKAIHWVDNLEPYIERKLYTVNTGHATAAYYGYNSGKKTIYEALSDPRIKKMVDDALSETSRLIIDKHGIPEEEQRAYVNAIVERISNPYLEDVVERVGRAPVRKLGRKERFIGPASQLAERGQKVDALMGAVEQALRFQNVSGDDESTELAKILREENCESATQKLTGLEPDHPLYDRVVEKVRKVQNESSARTKEKQYAYLSCEAAQAPATRQSEPKSTNASLHQQTVTTGRTFSPPKDQQKQQN